MVIRRYHYLIIGGALVTLFIFLTNHSTSLKTGDDYVRTVRNNSASNSNEVICSEPVPQRIEPVQQNITVQRFARNSNSDSAIKGNDLASKFSCHTLPNHKFMDRRDQYYVIYNFIKAQENFGCMESITLSAPGDFRFLDNVVALTTRWQGPISIALYAPGYDFYTTIDTISYLRQCQTNLIRDLVSFHLFFDVSYIPPTRNNTLLMKIDTTPYNCSLPPPWETVNDENTFKAKRRLLYPINVARNIAKLAAQTYFVFPSDIELYPTVNFIPQFLNFVISNLKLFDSNSKNVFALPIFEVLAHSNIPENKTVLQSMLKHRTAFLFHQYLCPMCHRVINGEKWVRAKETKGLHSFASGKRVGRHVIWEPFFVCTQKEPLWDERLSWEGQGNKIIQAYTMCVMDYTFHVLDNAFLIHRPGIKKRKVQMVKFSKEVFRSNRIQRQIVSELRHFYGYTKGCSMHYGYSWSKG